MKSFNFHNKEKGVQYSCVYPLLNYSFMNFKLKFVSELFVNFIFRSFSRVSAVRAFFIHTFSMQKNAKDKYVKHLRSNS